MSILSHICFKQRAVPPLTVRPNTPVPSQQEQHRYTTAGRLSSSAWYDQKHFSPLTNLSFAFVLPFNRRNKKIIFESGCRNLRFLYVSLSLSFLRFSLKRRGIWWWQILSLVWRNLRLDSCLRFSRIPLSFSQLKFRILSCETSAFKKTNLSDMKNNSLFLWFLQNFPTNFGQLRKFPSEYPRFRI